MRKLLVNKTTFLKLIDSKAKVNNTRMLRKVRPWLFIVKLIVLLVLLLLFTVSILNTTGFVHFILQICVGILFAHSVELAHQCIHKTGIGISVYDQFIGRFLGFLACVSFWHYLYWHLYHHKYNGTVYDKESFDYAYDLFNSDHRTMRIFGLILHFFQLLHYYYFLKRSSKAIFGLLAEELKANNPAMSSSITYLIQRDYQVMAFFLFLVILVSYILKVSFFIDIWLIPLLIGYGPAHSLIELPEHFGCEHPSNNVFTNTRSIKASRFLQWLTNFNCNHIGHHYDPLVPLEMTPRLEYILQKEYNFSFVEESYLQFYLRFIRAVWYGKKYL